MRRRQFLNLAANLAAMPLVLRAARAQNYPSRPVRWIVGAGAGSGPDVAARLVAPGLSDRLGQSVVIDNRPGAGGNIGTQAVVNAPPDGYTILALADSHAINATLYDNLNFNFARDIVPVASIVRVPFILVINPSVPVRSVPELIAYAKTNPGKLRLASSGNGTVSHVAGELFKMMLGVTMLNVPYRSSPPVFTDLIAGHVHVYFGALPLSIEHIRAGKLRALATIAPARSELLPDIPTMADFVPNYDASALYGVGVVKDTPVEIVDRLQKEINAVIAEPKVKAQLAVIGTPVAMSAAEYGKVIANDIEKWAKVIRAANIKPGWSP